MVNLRLPWLQEPWFLVLFVLKPWLIFVREHGNSERILDVALVVKLLPTLKHVININSQKSFTGGLWMYLKVMHGLHLFFFSAPDCWCCFTGIVVHQLWSFAFSRNHKVWAGADAGMARHILLFILNPIYRLFLRAFQDTGCGWQVTERQLNP